MDVFADIRSACAWVAARARRVRVDPDAAADLARRLAAQEEDAGGAAGPTLLADPRLWLGRGEETALYFLLLDTVNFGSGWFPTLRKRPGGSGFFHVAACLTDRFRAAGPPAPAELRALDARACAAWFEQDPANPDALALMGHFAAALRELAAAAADAPGSRLLGLVEAAAGDPAALVARLGTLPHWRDVADYDGRPVPFFKRAQLLVADLALAVAETPWGRWRGLERLTLFADNLVPHVLRHEGVLRLAPALAAAIDAGELLPAGSPAEVELRAGAVHAVELMAAAGPAAGGPAEARQLDYILWLRGQRPDFKARPRPRCRSTFY